MNEITPIENVRPVRLLFTDAPSSFSEMADEAQLAFVEEASEAGTRFVINFNDLVDARPDHPLIQQLKAISAAPANRSFEQICLEAC